jgi:hypothetical protein
MARAMLQRRSMLRHPVLFVAFVVAAALTSPVASAQTTTTTTTTTSGPTVSASGQPYPLRLTPSGASACGSGTSASNCTSTRPQNLNPLGISYADCVSNMVLQFSVTLDGFTGTDSLEVWASLTSDCTASTDRGIGATAAVCWGLRTGNIVDPVINTPNTYSFNIRVQDLVGWQQAPPAPGKAANPPAQGVSACSAQATFAAVPMNVNFLAIDSSGNSDGTPYQYQINTDMVGPPAPGGVGETVGETIYNITWTANSDSDTAGYDIFIDPIPGQESAGTSTGGQRLVCPDSGTTSAADVTTTGDGDLLESSDEGAEEATAPLPYDGGCYTLNTGGVAPTSQSGQTCNDSVLEGALTDDAGADAATTVVETFDDAGDLIDSGVEEGVGGISTIPQKYIYKQNDGFTIADKSVGKYTIEGLIDNVTYTTVVAAVDGTGNIGPPSAEVCDYPAAVRDFWENYEQDGGSAGSFCALETIGAGGSSLAGVGCFLALAAVVRRRRRNAP